MDAIELSVIVRLTDEAIKAVNLLPSYTEESDESKPNCLAEAIATMLVPKLEIKTLVLLCNALSGCDDFLEDGTETYESAFFNVTVRELKSRGVLSMVDLSYKWNLPASVREQLEEEFFLLPAVSRETEFFRNVLGYAINPWKAVEGRDEDSRKLAIVKLASSNRVKKPEDNKDKV